ncbi:MAG TPA: STAS domain-containing protein, partial [Bryobacteraceae bacterium]|nr:STAS domain-containing protein [Bryobacteraceae bacterium]
MSLEIEQREKEGITILDIKGRLTVGETASQLREKLKSMAASGVRSVVLNMKDVDYIDSTGL